jgi:hypothetical protein
MGSIDWLARLAAGSTSWSPERTSMACMPEHWEHRTAMCQAPAMAVGPDGGLEQDEQTAVSPAVDAGCHSLRIGWVCKTERRR